MSYSSENDDSLVMLVIFGIAAFIMFCVWKFSTALNLDLSTGGSVIFRMVVVLGLTGISWKFGDDFWVIALENTWPILLALFWWSWWPALDFWSNPIPLSSEFLPPGFDRIRETPIWWAAWYTKWGVSAFILGAGYLWNKTR